MSRSSSRAATRSFHSTRRQCTSRSGSATTSTSTRRSSTPRTWDASFALTRIRSCRTGATFLSAITAVRARSSSAEHRSCGPAARRKGPTIRSLASGRAESSTSSSSSGSSSASAARSVCRSRPPTSASTCSESCSSTTGARATSRRGSTSRSVPSSESRSRPRSRRGSRRSRSCKDRFVAPPAQDPSRSPTCACPRTGGSTSSSRSSSPERSFRGRTPALSTGRCRSSWRTRP